MAQLQFLVWARGFGPEDTNDKEARTGLIPQNLLVKAQRQFVTTAMQSVRTSLQSVNSLGQIVVIQVLFCSLTF